MMEMPPTDKCELCGNSRAFHKNKERDKRAGFHAFVPSARTQDAEIEREPLGGQGVLASTRSPMPSDRWRERVEALVGEHQTSSWGFYTVLCPAEKGEPCTCVRADRILAILALIEEVEREARIAREGEGER